MNKNKLNPNNESHWITHAEHEARRNKLTKWTNPTLWALLTQHGAAKPERTDSWWNDWAANNPTPQAIALGELDPSLSLAATMIAISKGARPVECE